MSRLQFLKNASTLHDVAALLNFKPKALSYILYRKAAVAKYRPFLIQRLVGGSGQSKLHRMTLSFFKRTSPICFRCAEK